MTSAPTVCQIESAAEKRALYLAQLPPVCQSITHIENVKDDSARERRTNLSVCVLDGRDVVRRKSSFDEPQNCKWTERVNSVAN